MSFKREATSDRQFEAIVKNLEQQCETAWVIVNHHRDERDCPDELYSTAAGLLNFLSDLGVPGYEM